jgi:two-component system, chemotaxis family, chemotaxis protein CheY
MASKTVLVLLCRPPSAESGRIYMSPQGLSDGEGRGDKDDARRRVVGSSGQAAGWGGRVDTEPPKRVAIVDDDFELLTTYSVVLEHLGYTTLTANDGDEIVDQVLHGHEPAPDVILMDYRMPKMNGLEAAKKILRNRPGVKIIMSTADDSVKQEAISAGMTFLQKPFSLGELASAIRESLGEDASAANP